MPDCHCQIKLGRPQQSPKGSTITFALCRSDASTLLGSKNGTRGRGVHRNIIGFGRRETQASAPSAKRPARSHPGLAAESHNATASAVANSTYMEKRDGSA